jgi:hypothetical protein
MPEQIENPHSSSFRPSDMGSAACLALRGRSSARGSRAVPCALGITRPVFCKVLADRTQAPLMGSRLIPEHRDSPPMPSPSAIKSPLDSDQNLTIGWNLWSESVRSETNGRDPRCSEGARIARFFCRNVRSTWVCQPPLRRVATSFSAGIFTVPSKPLAMLRRHRITPPRTACSRLETSSGLLWPRRCWSRMPAMRFGWPRRNHGAWRCW